MESTVFDRFAKSLSARSGRRQVLVALISAGVATLVGAWNASARPKTRACGSVGPISSLREYEYVGGFSGHCTKLTICGLTDPDADFARLLGEEFDPATPYDALWLSTQEPVLKKGCVEFTFPFVAEVPPFDGIATQTFATFPAGPYKLDVRPENDAGSVDLAFFTVSRESL